MHHGDSSEIAKALKTIYGVDKLERKLDGEQEKLGATGRYPEGKLTGDDEGEIKMAIASAPGKVVLDFGKPVKWVGFNPGQARELGELLLHHAEKANG